MTISSRPPRAALALLRRFVRDNAPLIGDMLEELESRQSRWWFWRQALVAILIASFRSFRTPREIRPLRLADGAFTPGSVTAQRRPAGGSRRAVNLSASPIEGIGGLGSVSLGALVTVVAPWLWAIALGAMLAGVALGIAAIAIGGRRAQPVPGDGRFRILFGGGTESREPAPGPTRGD
jgi:hypothetical protein